MTLFTFDAYLGWFGDGEVVRSGRLNRMISTKKARGGVFMKHTLKRAEQSHKTVIKRYITDLTIQGSRILRTEARPMEEDQTVWTVTIAAIVRTYTSIIDEQI